MLTMCELWLYSAPAPPASKIGFGVLRSAPLLSRSASRDGSSGRAGRVINAPEVFHQFWRKYPFELVEQLFKRRQLTRTGEECFALSLLDKLHSIDSSRFALGDKQPAARDLDSCSSSSGCRSSFGRVAHHAPTRKHTLPNNHIAKTAKPIDTLRPPQLKCAGMVDARGKQGFANGANP